MLIALAVMGIPIPGFRVQESQRAIGIERGGLEGWMEGEDGYFVNGRIRPSLYPLNTPAATPLPPHNGAGLPVLSPALPRRRAVLFSSIVSVVPAVAPSFPASAFSIGISGPKEWLKEQKRKSSKYLLAPIYASREILQSAYLILSKGSESSAADAEEIQRLFRSAARDCVTEDRNSFVMFQANTGVEVCTFALIVKNAASLLDNKDPVKLEAEAVLDDLIRSFSSLTSLANGTDLEAIANSKQKIIDALMDTITSLDKFEKGVMDCLEA